MTFEDAMERYGDIANHQADKLAKAEGAAWDALFQEAQIYLWENLDKVGRWEDAHGVYITRNKVSAEIKYHLRHYLAAERAVTGEALPMSFTSTDPDDGEILFEGEAVSPIPWGRGTEAEFCDCPAGQELEVFREIMTAFERVDPDVQEMFREHFIDGVSYSELARRRGLHVSAINKRISRTIDKIRDDVIEKFPQPEARNKVPLRSGSEGYGIKAPLGSRTDRPRLAWRDK